MFLALFLSVLLSAKEDSFKGLDKIEKPPFRIYHDTGEKLTSIILSAAEDALLSLRENAGLEVPCDVTIVVLSNRKSYERFVKEKGGERFTVGVTFTERSLIVVDASAGHAITSPASSVVRHELFHIALSQFVSRNGVKVPLWFNEGVAQLFEQRAITRPERQEIATLAKGGELPLFSFFEETYPSDEYIRRIMYLSSVMFVSFLTNGKISELQPFFTALREKRNFEESFRLIFGADVSSLEDVWRHSLAEDYSFWLQLLYRTNEFLFFGILVIVTVVIYFIRRRRTLRQMDELEKTPPH
ncbi:MAG: hypothetical protein N2234_06595 [Planctomycetota bacterium]|nr:hypothetical protein [Planctomycetota bacterium]